MGDRQRISYLPLEAMDQDMRAEMERCRREGAPRPESSAVRAHVPACFWLSRGRGRRSSVTVSRSRRQGAMPCLCVAHREVRVPRESALGEGQAYGLSEAKCDYLLNFETSTKFGDREKAALAYAEANWRLNAGDELWERLHRHLPSQSWSSSAASLP